MTHRELIVEGIIEDIMDLLEYAESSHNGLMVERFRDRAREVCTKYRSLLKREVL